MAVFVLAKQVTECIAGCVDLQFVDQIDFTDQCGRKRDIAISREKMALPTGFEPVFQP